MGQDGLNPKHKRPCHGLHARVVKGGAASLGAHAHVGRKTSNNKL